MDSQDKPRLDVDRIYKDLQAMRNVGWHEPKEDDEGPRAEIASPLINAILGLERKWSSGQCEFFFEKLLEEYCPPDHLENMRAVSGLEEEYRNITKATVRRRKFFNNNKGKGLFRATKVDSLRTDENNILKGMADKIQTDFESGKLNRFVSKLFSEVSEVEPASDPKPSPEPQPEPVNPQPGSESPSEPGPNQEPDPGPPSEPNPRLNPKPKDDNTNINTSPLEDPSTADLTKANKRLRAASITAFILIALILVAVVGSFIYLNNYTINFTVDLKERFYGRTAWNDELNVELGDVIEYRLEFANNFSPLSSALLSLCDNLGISVTSRKVKVQFTLPDNLEYVEGSTALYDSDIPDGISTITNDLFDFPDGSSTVIDTITTSGIDIDPSFINANGSIRIRCKVLQGDLVLGFNEDTNTYIITGTERIVTWATATIGDTVEKDSATLFLKY